MKKMIISNILFIESKVNYLNNSRLSIKSLNEMKCNSPSNLKFNPPCLITDDLKGVKYYIFVDFLTSMNPEF